MKDGILMWAEIDLDAIDFNIRAIQRFVGSSTQVMAIVKANAYGHGAVPVARAALQAGATRLGVHRIQEGFELRKGGIDAPILVLGYTPPDGAELVVRWNLTASVGNRESAEALNAAAISAGVRLPVHVKVDTGMSRYGVMAEDALPYFQWVGTLHGLLLEGMFTHFAAADAADMTHARMQLKRFLDVRSALSQAGITVPIVHAAASAAIMSLPEAHLDMVRPGICLYGLDPSTEKPNTFEIHPVMTIKGRVCRLQTLPVGAEVSYSRLWRAERPTLAALLPGGYGDGWRRNLTNRGSVLIRGHRAPMVGRVCMDQFVVDVTDVPDVALHDEAVLVGTQGNARIPMEEVSKLSETINYDTATSLLPRVARFFMRGGQVVEESILAED